MLRKKELVKSRGVGMTDSLWEKLTDAAKVRDMTVSEFCSLIIENFLVINAQKTEEIRQAKENYNRAKIMFDEVKQSVAEGSYEEVPNAG